MIGTKKIPGIREATARKLSFSFPIHESAIQGRRIKERAELRRIQVILDGRERSLGIFFARGFDPSGQDSIRVLFDGKFQTIKLVSPKRVKAKESVSESKKEFVFKGIAASPGIAIGKAMLWFTWEKGLPIRKYEISAKDIEKEINRFRKALEKARKYYEELIEANHNKIVREIYGAHKLFLEDQDLIGKVETRIKEERLNAEHVLEDVINICAQIFEGMREQYLKEKAADVRNVGRVLLEKLSGRYLRKKIEGEEVILVAEEIAPTDIGEIRKARARVLALVAERGGPTSHAALIAKELGIPAVLGIENATARIRDNDGLAVDGRVGEVVCNPSEIRLEDYKKHKEKFDFYVLKLRGEVQGKRARTRDGYRVSLGANLMSEGEFAAATAFEIDEVGLLRTESLYSGRSVLPSEEEHIEIYQAFGKMPVKIRTFDLGGDKKVPKELRLPPETNPFLGLRGIRLYDYNDLWREAYRTQIRGILRASADNPKLSVMFPMISKLYEFRWAKKIIEEEKQKLSREKKKFNKKIKLGIMVEVPSVVSFASQFAEEVDYFSFGSNDMIQFMFAKARGSSTVAYLYDPFHFSIIWSLKRIIEAAHKVNKPVYLCGDMGSDPLATFLLVGLRIDGISMVASDIPKIKYILLGLKQKEIQDFTQRMLREFYPFTAATKDMSIRDQLKEIILDEFPLDVIERINLVEGKLSSGRVT